jgi:hypothetical protein
MLARVEVLSRLGPQFVEKSELPKGFEDPRTFVLCGMEPARNLDNSAAFVELAASSLDGASVANVVGGLKGLVDGVGRDVFESEDCCPLMPFIVPTGGNLDGTVPALALLAGLLRPVSAGGTKSGKPSWVGDSGMFSRRGVELPLAVGGPHMLGESPS